MSEEYIINANTGNILNMDIYWQDEVQINVDMGLVFVKSGEKEINNYVQNVAKPEIANFVKNEAEPLVSHIIKDQARPIIKTYLEQDILTEIDDYIVDEKIPQLENIVDTKIVEIHTIKNDVELLAENCATYSEISEQNVLLSQQSIEQTKQWAEMAEAANYRVIIRDWSVE